MNSTPDELRTGVLQSHLVDKYGIDADKVPVLLGGSHSIGYASQGSDFDLFVASDVKRIGTRIGTARVIVSTMNRACDDSADLEAAAAVWRDVYVGAARIGRLQAHDWVLMLNHRLLSQSVSQIREASAWHRITKDRAPDLIARRARDELEDAGRRHALVSSGWLYHSDKWDRQVVHDNSSLRFDPTDPSEVIAVSDPGVRSWRACCIDALRKERDQQARLSPGLFCARSRLKALKIELAIESQLEDLQGCLTNRYFEAAHECRRRIEREILRSQLVRILGDGPVLRLPTSKLTGVMMVIDDTLVRKVRMDMEETLNRGAQSERRRALAIAAMNLLTQLEHMNFSGLASQGFRSELEALVAS